MSASILDNREIFFKDFHFKFSLINPFFSFLHVPAWAPQQTRTDVIVHTLFMHVYLFVCLFFTPKISSHLLDLPLLMNLSQNSFTHI